MYDVEQEITRIHPLGNTVNPLHISIHPAVGTRIVGPWSRSAVGGLKADVCPSSRSQRALRELNGSAGFATNVKLK